MYYFSCYALMNSGKIRIAIYFYAYGCLIMIWFNTNLMVFPLTIIYSKFIFFPMP